MTNGAYMCLFCLHPHTQTSFWQVRGFPYSTHRGKKVGICTFAQSRNVCSYLGHADPKRQGVNFLSGNKGFPSEGRDGGASLWEDDKEKIKIHQNGAISSTDQGSSDEDVGLTRAYQ